MTQNAPEFVLCLYRATTDLERSVAFLEALGLHRTVERDQDGTAFLWGRSGMVALFDAAHEGPAPVGETQLSFETPDLTAAADHLGARGTRVAVWDDEGEQRSAGLQDPAGRGVFLRESMRDAADGGEPPAPDAVDVVAVRESTDFAADEAFFGSLGFARAYGDEHWAALQGPGDAGVIGLHAPWGDPEPKRPAGSPALVHLGFQTAGDLRALGERLAAAGFAARPADRGRPVLLVTDPDGIELEVHGVG